MRRFPIRLGLRDRVTLGFGLLAFALSVLLSLVVWTLVSHYLVDQRQTTAVTECTVDANVLTAQLDVQIGAVPQILDGLPSNDRLASIVFYRGSWYSTGLGYSRQSIPRELITLAADGTPGTQRFTIGKRLYLAVALSLSDPGGVYIEVFPMSEVQHAIHTLSLALVVAALATAVAGLGVGRLASRRALRPLAQLTSVAGQVARGDLTTRLDAQHDPDLDGLARSFNATTAALENRVKADARFAGDVSHQLRTPLTTMLNSMELLANRRSELPAAMGEPLDLLAMDLARFRRLVVELLEISRDDSGVPAVLEHVRITDLVSQAADAAAGRPVTELEPGACDVLVQTDKRRLEQVVTNLVENAEIHGGGCLRVLVRHQADAVSIEVDDGGAGIPPESREAMFERFVRGSRAQSPGSGLGLAIVARHVQSLSGQVRVEDRPGGGARFVVEFPRPGPDRPLGNKGSLS